MPTGHLFGKAALIRCKLVPYCGSLLVRNLVVSGEFKHLVAGPTRADNSRQCSRRAYRMSSRYQAFVGEKTKSAEEYHSADFDFWEHKAAVDEQLAKYPSAYHVPEGTGESFWGALCQPLHAACRRNFRNES